MLRHLSRICALEDQFLSDIENHPELGPAETGAIVDMVKDMTEAKKNCYKAEYYKEAAEELERAEMRERYGDPADSMGYDKWRYSSGRFSPKGRGHYAGYVPEVGMMWDPEMDEEMMHRLGYPANMGSGNRGKSMTGGSRRGYTYDNYHDAKISGHKDRMGHHADEYMMETAQSIKEMWADADPEQKKKMKANLTKLVGELA